jgi:prolyl oligopeptidase
MGGAGNVLHAFPARSSARPRGSFTKRLTELLSIGNIGVPQLAGKYYFYTRRDGMQNQPVLYVREGLEGKDRVLVDANQLADDGTVALDWYQASENGKYVAYGTSSSGSEMSTLHVIETNTGLLLPDTIERTRYASVAWTHDNSRFLLHALPQERRGRRRPGKLQSPRFLSRTRRPIPPKTQPIFGEGRDPGGL